jgi:hypothetical protein
MAKPVAVDGDTQFKTSSKHISADTDNAGSWSLVNSNVTKGTKVSVGGKFVEIMATATWSYTGGTASGNPVPPVPDSATLSPGPTILEDSGSHILVDGDKATGTADSDNQIVVSASQQKLETN